VTVGRALAPPKLPWSAGLRIAAHRIGRLAGAAVTLRAMAGCAFRITTSGGLAAKSGSMVLL